MCFTNRENIGKLDVLKAKTSGADGLGVNNWNGHMTSEEASLAKGLQEVRDCLYGCLDEEGLSRAKILLGFI